MNYKFYTFDQNNSGGKFHHFPEKGIGSQVCIQALDFYHAISIAEKIGLYFDGVSDDLDCECCGDRWYRYADENDQPKCKNWSNIPGYIHYIDGKIEKVESNDK